MKFNKVMIATALIFGVTSFAHAADADDAGTAAAAKASTQGQGKVTFKGSIIDAPCSISADSVDQTIELGAISNASLKNSGSSKTRNFDIKLEQCDMSTPKTVKITFNGNESPHRTGFLGIYGTAKGASVGLIDSAGRDVKIGTETTSYKLTEGDNTLRFAAYLKGDGVDANIVAGEFTSVTDFTLAYQ